MFTYVEAYTELELEFTGSHPSAKAIKVIKRKDGKGIRKGAQQKKRITLSFEKVI